MEYGSYTDSWSIAVSVNDPEPETGIERYFREQEEAESGFECICGVIPHNNLCKVWNRRRKLEREQQANAS